MTATTQVQIYGFKDQLVVTTRFQLLQWKHALNIEIATGMTTSRGKTVANHLRELLETPPGYPVENIQAHIAQSIDDIDEQFQTGNFNLEARA